MEDLIDFNLTGFVDFRHLKIKSIKTIDTGRTAIYLVARNNNNTKNSLELPLIGSFCGDDMSPRKSISTIQKSIESIIKEMSELQIKSKEFYFKDDMPFKTTSNILIGWSKYSYEYIDRIDPWCCTFKELTIEGRKLYYSLKKLHNNAEVRILTFNNIK